MKLVVNRCYGGFGLSLEAKLLYLRKAGYPNAQVYTRVNNSYGQPFKKLTKEEYNTVKKWPSDHYVTYEDLGEQVKDFRKGELFCDFNLERNNPILIEVVEELGDKANNLFSDLEIVEIPDGVNYEIDDYDGYETVEEVHRSW